MNVIGENVEIKEQFTESIRGNPAFTFISSTIFLVPTRTEVPVSITPELRVQLYPAMETY